ncbi:hypothetical protein [Apibacter adventoris]|uniref:Phage abortive infection protein n=1 Tax=Apibacter adventoris TaxID=1679466 RepID=A0A2S8AF35_9FLAO|nr:hypothetical protein [Apibacter adventoris]PQL94248.1 hypothetical protein C4S77_03550 [Apibacter adventoris]
MEENIKAIIENYTLNAFQVALISAIVSFITFLLTIVIKNYFENKLHKRKLETEHKFNQQKKIKDVLAKYKVHLLTACEDFNYRMWNFSENHSKGWHCIPEKDNDYSKPHYYFHSFIYRFLSIFAWIKKIQKEIIFIDTTLASKNDLEFIKFLRVISQLFCDLQFVEGKNADGTHATDHFFRDNLNLFPDVIITENGLKSYSEYIQNLKELQQSLHELYCWFDGISPVENRRRWDRLYFLHLTVMIFLNNYGYDFQKTDKDKLRQVLANSKRQVNMNGFFELLKRYKLNDNNEVEKLMQLNANLRKESNE